MCQYQQGTVMLSTVFALFCVRAYMRRIIEYVEVMNFLIGLMLT